MQQVEAARETIAIMNARTGSGTRHGVELPKDMQPDHLNDMLRRMEADANPQGGRFSEGKLGRWLGWMQASCCALGVLSLDECKEINRKWSSN